jgi:hypothetical protein
MNDTSRLDTDVLIAGAGLTGATMALATYAIRRT